MPARNVTLRLINDIRIPIIAVMTLIALSIANSKYSWVARPPAAISILYLLLRVALAGMAGYIATYRSRIGLWGAAIAGGLVFLAENIVIVAWFMSIEDWPDVGRVAQAFVTFVWVAMVLGVVGGWIGRTRRLREAAAN